MYKMFCRFFKEFYMFVFRSTMAAPIKRTKNFSTEEISILKCKSKSNNLYSIFLKFYLSFGFNPRKG